MTDRADRDDAILLAHAYVDGELGPAEALAFEKRLREEPELAAEAAAASALSRAIREKLPPVQPSPALRRRIEASLPRRKAWGASWMAMAASVVLGLGIGGGATWSLLRPAPEDVLSDGILASHIRGLMAPQPTDVASSDRHTVKPWFNGRIPQAPRVVDLSGAGFTLLGGRVDIIGRTPVPTLVYRRRQHVISLYAIPREASGPPASGASDGYNVLGWEDGGTRYWAVSDLNPRELAEFAASFRSAG